MPLVVWWMAGRNGEKGADSKKQVKNGNLQTAVRK